MNKSISQIFLWRGSFKKDKRNLFSLNTMYNTWLSVNVFEVSFESPYMKDLSWGFLCSADFEWIKNPPWSVAQTISSVFKTKTYYQRLFISYLRRGSKRTDEKKTRIDHLSWGSVIFIFLCLVHSDRYGLVFRIAWPASVYADLFGSIQRLFCYSKFKIQVQSAKCNELAAC